MIGRIRGSLAVTAAVVLLTALVAGCAPEAVDAEVVYVDLADFTVALDRDTVSAGTVEFIVRNDGPSLHEIEIFSGAASGDELTVENTVADTSGLELVDEVENVLVDGVTRLTVDLEPGTYLVICNLPEHFDHGMWTTLTVTEG